MFEPTCRFYFLPEYDVEVSISMKSLLVSGALELMVPWRRLCHALVEAVRREFDQADAATDVLLLSSPAYRHSRVVSG